MPLTKRSARKWNYGHVSVAKEQSLTLNKPGSIRHRTFDKLSEFHLGWLSRSSRQTKQNAARHQPDAAAKRDRACAAADVVASPKHIARLWLVACRALVPGEAGSHPMEEYRLPDVSLVVESIHSNEKKTHEVELYANWKASTEPPNVGRVLVVPSARCPYRLFDPNMYHTAVCATRITFADGVNGKLYYRGYDVEDLVRRTADPRKPTATFEEVAFLLINGELPDRDALSTWKELLLSHTFLHEDILAQLRTLRHDAPPMGCLIAAVSALSTFHPEANPALRGSQLYRNDEKARNKQVYRLLGKVATIAACVWRVRIGRQFIPPLSGEQVRPRERTAARAPTDRQQEQEPGDAPIGYVSNFLTMLDGCQPNPVLVNIVERAWIVLADDGLNCAAGVLRHVASSGADPYVCVATAMAAIYGQRISGVGMAVMRMLTDMHAYLRSTGMLDETHEKQLSCLNSYLQERYILTKRRLQGFGHVNYKKYDPRARVLRELCLEAEAAVQEPEPLLQTALLLEEVVTNNIWFTSRGVWPNVDLYLPLLLRILGLPLEFYAVFVAVPRTAGWIAHWLEQLDDADVRIYRPRQLYSGPPLRPYVPMEDRVEDVLSSFAEDGQDAGSDQDDTAHVLRDGNARRYGANRQCMLRGQNVLNRMVRSVSIYRRRSYIE
ncbi:citrate synthase [Cyanidioschyzon merolae strain 10D]|uniref:Citrate synthase n=1 Tax=Cyanidioschyzon merolae (strain NIES-3377 / 10D) TaxID=280699 RepID=M1UT78_CYAM1|nr:citrate synthase [Cyanidioschyzon merolae strain 10D]BAM80951.1 citrate synthase [Cyanidioschyzon merolae strain 10D]|eukprot:XP_005536987.1 citrate synthase [Cyanidioschyzon merolae strain 10D]